MISDFTYFKKLSLAFAITCAVAANTGTVQAGWFGFGSSTQEKDASAQGIGAGIELKKETVNGDTELSATEKVVISKGAKDAAGNAVEKVKDGVQNVERKAGILGRKAAQDAKNKTAEVAQNAAAKANAAKENAKSWMGSLSDFAKNVGSTTWAAVRYPYDKAKEITVNIVGNPYTDHPFITGLVVGGFTTGVVYHYVFNKHANRQLVRNITAEDAQKVIIANAIVDYNTAQTKYDAIVAKVQAQGGATATDEAALAAAQNEVAMRYAALAALLRSQKSTLDIIKAALSINLPSSR